MIQLENVNKIYQTTAGAVTALADINFHVPQGKIFGVIGKSGAGKSTLIRCINMLEKPTSGAVSVDGQHLEKLKQRELLNARRHISMIFQHFNLLSTRSVFANVALPLQLAGHSKRDIESKVLPLLELTGLLDRKKSFPSQLSGGQKQRVAIARALASQPKVLLCDEATSSLDPQTTTSILNLLKDINEKLGLTILLITHEMEVVKQICDQLALIEDGRIIEQAEIAAFFARPQTAIGKEYVRSCLRLELPKTMQEKLRFQHNEGDHQVLRISFHGEATGEPLISYLVKELGLTINILQANIESIQREIIGIMIVAVHGNLDKLNDAIKFLKSKSVDVESMGYLH